MPNLTDYIEDYLKKLLAISSRRYVDIQRRELAGKFACVPSQINYVLSSRFSMERGYLVESRRGGSGYIRIYRISPLQTQTWPEILQELASEKFEPVKALQFIKRIYEERMISLREAGMVESLLKDEHYAALSSGPGEIRELQKRLFKASLETILKGSY